MPVYKHVENGFVNRMDRGSTPRNSTKLFIINILY